MATLNVTVTGSWAQAGAAGPMKYNLQSQSQKVVEYATGASAPAVVGIRLRPSGMHPVDVPEGERLYLRCIGAESGDRVVLADVV